MNPTKLQLLTFALLAEATNLDGRQYVNPRSLVDLMLTDLLQYGQWRSRAQKKTAISRDKVCCICSSISDLSRHELKDFVSDQHSSLKPRMVRDLTLFNLALCTDSMREAFCD